MGDLQNKKLILLKGALFLVLGTLALCLIYLETLSVRVVALASIASWAFCRFYYFIFYVVERYVDSRYRYSGLLDMLRRALFKGDGE